MIFTFGKTEADKEFIALQRMPPSARFRCGRIFFIIVANACRECLRCFSPMSTNKTRIALHGAMLQLVSVTLL
ncbi:MAG TPA: hypothetical protein VKP67_03090 [Xanthobacteraceae bacterium]|nr:hypothetical protein [Xanthobacteraceae bacterium]